MCTRWLHLRTQRAYFDIIFRIRDMILQCSAMQLFWTKFCPWYFSKAVQLIWKLYNAKILAASHCCLYILKRKTLALFTFHFMLTDQSFELSKLSERSLTEFWNFKITLVEMPGRDIINDLLLFYSATLCIALQNDYHRNYPHAQATIIFDWFNHNPLDCN